MTDRVSILAVCEPKVEELVEISTNLKRKHEEPEKQLQYGQPAVQRAQLAYQPVHLVQPQLPSSYRWQPSQLPSSYEWQPPQLPSVPSSYGWQPSQLPTLYVAGVASTIGTTTACVAVYVAATTATIGTITATATAGTATTATNTTSPAAAAAAAEGGL
ncbi:hypothetical protein IWW56_005658 [Coemansia sp. RSA 2131]|nr:hypothetical protein IWW56_005658 [Coemansia sp. RSA 2131]